MKTDRDGTDVVAIADAIAVQAHQGQTDKLGNDYIEHPRSVARRVDQSNPAAIAAALLHDVVEDSEMTPADLADQGIPADVIASVELLTRRDDVSDDDYYAAIVKDAVALEVKLADLADNTDPSRLGLLDEATQRKLTTKYAKAYRALGRDDLAVALAQRHPA
ncbi:MAG: guanosine-3',5'-bis(diphosphate) 3'-pyrophosphohydrolase [Gordonia sp. (in: high G+C Gram-positive bacteria)]|nr:MAG: guanosine-3',5'-bis(diphosphate) 3'-pyrophosphohydrolase [Gordonia sp. (in: high G+C Gram-positive bacteria)]